jgi:hypothetical protein
VDMTKLLPADETELHHVLKRITEAVELLNEKWTSGRLQNYALIFVKWFFPPECA